ncbi:hypothetical protein EDB83DRAFT_1952114 [Lactarius deliciosus]|nr:hypothetical protein EDB83DRAFT_1952114 [Lactarius deliciosus]
MKELGCPEGRGLLFRPEYDIALESLDEHQDSAEEGRCGGIVVTGQLGIGKTCFLYYLLFCKLSKKTPVALQLSNHILVFRDDGVLDTLSQQILISSRKVLGPFPTPMIGPNNLVIPFWMLPFCDGHGLFKPALRSRRGGKRGQSIKTQLCS